jgi:hypothetical protein
MNWEELGRAHPNNQSWRVYHTLSKFFFFQKNLKWIFKRTYLKSCKNLALAIIWPDPHIVIIIIGRAG